MRTSPSVALWTPILLAVCYFSTIDESEMSHDQAKTCLANQHDRPLSENYFEPEFL